MSDNIYLARLPDDWSIFYPAHNTTDGLVAPTVGIVGAQMVVFNRSIGNRIIRELEVIMSRPGGHELGGPMHVDGAYSTIRAQNPDIKTYACAPALGYQRSSRSDITTRFFDRISIVRPLAAALRSTIRRAVND